MSPARERQLSRDQLVVLAVSGFALCKLVVGSLLPLSGDEALYWMYSKHLSFGYIDHPVMNPLMIRIGTTLFGDTSLGVRFMPVIAGLLATWPIARAASLLSGDEQVGRLAAIFFNLSTAMFVGAIAATSDIYVVCTSAFLLYFLAKLAMTQDQRWWLAVGAAFGLGMCSKYTTAFFAVSIVLWLAISRSRRAWMASPWAWAGALVAALIFAPVFAWNAAHHWASFTYQSNRMKITQLSLGWLGELIVSQALLLSLPIFVLACIGLWPKRAETAGARTLLLCLVAPIATYFAWHSLHERVQGNWPEAAFPAAIVAAAWAAAHVDLSARPLARWSRRLALPVGLLVAALAFQQALLGLIPTGRTDPVGRVLAYGWTDVAGKIDAARRSSGAAAVVSTDYQVLGWLAFYLPPQTQVFQLNERIRWEAGPQPSSETLSQPLLYVCKADCPELDALRKAFSSVELVRTIDRNRKGVTLSTYSLYRIASPTMPVLDPLYPAMKIYGERNE
jgi:4-amino-4-deoxy-L-arabinose transferase-like glycosyltransferase